MKKHHKEMIFIVVLCYFAFAFVIYELSFFLWNEFQRALLIMILGLAIFIYNIPRLS